MRSSICMIVALFALFHYIPAIDAIDAIDAIIAKNEKCCCDVYGFNEVLANLTDWSCHDHILFDFPLTVVWSDGTSSAIGLSWVIDINNAVFKARGTGSITGTAFSGFFAEFRLDLNDYSNGCVNGVGISEVSGSASLFIRSIGGGGVYGRRGWRSCSGEATITFNPAIPLVDNPNLVLVDHTVIVFDRCVGPCLR